MLAAGSGVALNVIVIAAVALGPLLAIAIFWLGSDMPGDTTGRTNTFALTPSAVRRHAIAISHTRASSTASL